MNLSHLLTCLSVVAVSVSAECTSNQTNTARELFKDCMDMAQANLLKINIEDEDNNIDGATSPTTRPKCSGKVSDGFLRSR